jgi:hypothetical protein
MPNQTLDRMTRSAVSRIFQGGRFWRAPRHRSALTFGVTRTASAISFQDQFFYVSNQRFQSLIEFGLEVGEKTATTDEERSFVSDLRKRSDAFYPGYDFAIEREFPSRIERKFWARVFFDLAHLIFRREIGNQDATFWQYSAVGDAYLLGRVITRSVQEEEQAWHPKTMASIEADAFHQKGVNLRL